jgi:hypothetical protein
MMERGELYVMARRVLLDALDALRDHRGAIVLARPRLHSAGRSFADLSLESRTMGRARKLVASTHKAREAPPRRLGGP